jgi:DNA-binding NtrC family response regulator
LGDPYAGGRISALTLLIVDDDRAIAKALARQFARRGYATILATSGASAMDILRVRQIDGIVIDFRIPDVRGDVLFAAAVALQPHLRDRTVFMSGDLSDAVSDALSDTQSPLVRKPLDLPALERLVDAMMRRRAPGEWAPGGNAADGG